MTELNLTLRQELWRRGHLAWKLHAAQKLIYEQVQSVKTREYVILASRRFGKSYLGCIMALEFCLQNPGKRVNIIAPNRKHATDIVVPLIDKIIKDAPKGLVKRTKSEYKWHVGGADLVLGGFDTASDSFRGTEGDLIIIEESGFADPNDYEYIMRSIIKPLLLHSRGKLIHLTTPPRSADHPFVSNTIPEAKVNKSFWQFTLYDNPLLDDEQRAMAVKDCGGIHTDDFRREYMCEIIRDSNFVVIPSFTQARHVKPFGIPESRFTWTAIDGGGKRDRTVALLLMYDYVRAKILVVDERDFAPNTTSDVITDSIKSMEKANFAWSEHEPCRWSDSPGQVIADWYKLHDFQVMMPFKDEVDAQINIVNLKMATDKIEVHPRCVTLIACLEYGMFNDKRTDFIRTPTLGHLDALMALVYGVRMMNDSNPFPELPLPDNSMKRPARASQRHWSTSPRETDIQTINAFRARNKR